MGAGRVPYMLARENLMHHEWLKLTLEREKKQLPVCILFLEKFNLAKSMFTFILMMMP